MPDPSTRADDERFRRYWDGEAPQIGDVVRLGANEKALPWTVSAIRGETLALKRGLSKRYSEYISHYKLVRRG